MPTSTPAEREADILDTLVRLADTVVRSPDELEVLRDLAESAVRLLDGDTAGISLGDGERLAFVIGTSEAMDIIELYQTDQQQGPCTDAYHSGVPVHTADIAADRDRWPMWAARALDLGFRSADSFPMRQSDHIIGAMNVYAVRARELGTRDIAVAAALADMATIGILHERSDEEHKRTRAQLQRALDSRVIIEQAKGVLASRHAITPDAAFERLRGHARRHNDKLAHVARSVVDAGIDV